MYHYCNKNTTILDFFRLHLIQELALSVSGKCMEQLMYPGSHCVVLPLTQVSVTASLVNISCYSLLSFYGGNFTIQTIIGGKTEFK